jgi:hypothetical protein
MLWEHHPTVAIFEEIDAIDRVSLKVHILVLLDDDRLEKWAYPSEEGARLVLQELQSLVQVLVQVNRQLHLQLVGQLLSEVVHVVEVVLRLKVQRLL